MKSENNNDSATTYDTIFNVHFKGSSLIDNKDLTLTFFLTSSFDSYELNGIQSFFLKFNELTRGKKAQSINNIKNVIPSGATQKAIASQKYSNYSVLSFTPENESPKSILIGLNKQGHFFLGISPYSERQYIESISKIKMVFEEIINNTDKFTDLLLIS